MTCIILVNSSVTFVIWYRVVSVGFEVIVVGLFFKYSGGLVITFSFIIFNIVDSDGGIYRCIVINVVGIGSSVNVILDVVGSEWEV